MELGSLILALVLVLANGFFVAVEFALVKLRPTQLDSLVEQGRPGAKLASAMRKSLDTWLSVSQVGITLASLALGRIGQPAFAALLDPILVAITPFPDAGQELAHIISTVSAYAVITFLHIVVGEQVPKNIAISQAEKVALWLAWPMKAFSIIAFPVIWVLNSGTRWVLKLLRLDRVSETDHEAMGEDELRLIFTSSAQAGAIEQSRADLLERALSMMEKTARQVLVPRSQMKCLDLEASLEHNLTVAHEAGHTWMPVIRGSLDRVEGMVNVKDLYFFLNRSELKSIEQVQRPVLFVPENITLEQLLAEFRRRNKQTAVVVDEHGGTSGIVTVSDVVAELVGKVAEIGRKTEPVRALPGGKIEFPGTAQLDDLEFTLETEFDVDKAQVTTIAGYLMAKLGRVPVQGDSWVRDRYRIVVVKVDGPRVLTVRVEPKLPAVPRPSVPPPAASKPN